MTDKNDSLDEFAKLIWGKRAEGLPVPELDLKRAISPQELLNIYQRYAYIQILDSSGVGEYTEIKFTHSRAGWLILNYQSAMSASPGELLFSHGNYEMNDEGSLERICTGIGTITLQIINTAADMVLIAKNEEHWSGIQIVSGHPLMVWGIWKAAKDLNMPVIGFVPSKADEAKYKRIKDQCPSLIMPTPEPAPTKP